MQNADKRGMAGWFLMALFAISGAAGLIYESIWTQYLGLFLGHAAYAQSFVLMLFMGGMAIGAWLTSRYSERIARPLAAYAIVEFVVGVLGVAFDPIYHGATGFAYAHLFPALGSGLGLDLVRYLVATVIIGAQCVLLGMTFPLMSAGFLRIAPSSGGRVLASLYFSNSFGAAVGALVATFVLLPAVGLPGSIMTGGLLSIAVAIVIWPMARAGTVASPRSQTTAEGLAPVFILLAAAITGASSFVYEVTWVRMLSLALGSTIHAFELMLAAFISGIAFGGLWLRRHADGLRSALVGAGWAQVLMGVAALGSLFVYMHAFDWVVALRQTLSRGDSAYTAYNFATAAISMSVMFPAAFFAGMTLPLLTLSLLRGGTGEAAIGKAYAVNTLGAIVGVLLTMHVLMPMLGVRIALWLAAVADLALGVFLLWYPARAGRPAPRRQLAVASIIALVAAVTAIAATRVDPLVLASSAYRVNRARLAEGTDMLFYGDGKTATVALYSTPGPQGVRSISTNGKVDAAIAMGAGDPTPDEYTMAMAAALPLAMHPSPKSVGVIGFGSGLTAHTFLGSDRVERVDVIEIEPMMVEAARHFVPRVERVYSDPRAHIIIDDAKAFLSASSQRYDVIISEPSNPWVNGVAALFTEEFYDFVPSHLAEDGLFVQWLQVYEITPELVATVLKAMLPRFADVEVYTSNVGDLVLVASPTRKLPPLVDLGARDERLKQDLARLSISSAADFNRFRLMDRNGLAALALIEAAPANSDLFPVLQLLAPKARFKGSSATGISALEKSPWPLLEVIGGYVPTPASVKLGEMADRVPRDPILSAARKIRESLRSASALRDVPEGLLLNHAVMLEQARSCKDINLSLWANATSVVAGASIPYFQAADLEGVWIDPQWLDADCRSHAGVNQVLAFMAELASRDWPAVASLGPMLLEDPSFADAIQFRNYVTVATELAFTAQGDVDGLARIDDRYGKGLGQYQFEIRLMRASASLRRAAIHARDKPLH